MTRAALLVASLVGVLGCGEPELDKGRVVSKHHEAARVTTVYIPIQTGSVCSGGKYPSCSPIFTPFPFTEFDDEDWVLRLRDCPKPKQCREGNAYVSESVYSEASAGQWFDATTDPKLMRDEPKRRRK